MGIAVQAPPDITVTVKTKCDTNLILPPAIFTGNCSGILSASTTNGITTLNTNGGLMNFSTGVYKVIYTLTDDCMTGKDTMMVTVFDNQGPTAICSPPKTVDLGTFGDAFVSALLFNGGSTDNCNKVYFKVKRVSVPLGIDCSVEGNPDNHFDDRVRFCCSDVDASPIMVILRVYDIAPPPGPVSDNLYQGHFSDCMTEVSVFDKLRPVLICQDNITVSCGANLDSALKAGALLVTDNCFINSLDSTIKYNINSCGNGNIKRTYTATDNNGLTASCTQTITVNPNSVFNGLDTSQLKWPSSKTLYVCRVNLDDATIEKTGKPILNDGVCDLVAVRYNDDLYNFSRGGICAKIIRTWEVINWCVYNPNLTPNPKIPSNGYYKYYQEIKFIDTVAPIFTPIPDVTASIESPTCGDGLVNFPIATANDCGVNTGLSYLFEVDYNSDGKIDVTGTGNDASGFYPLGHHIVYYIALDSCHNEGKQKINLTVRDGKAPNANVLHGLSSSVTQMANGIMLMINASAFNNSSSDNCTSANKLRFSFSSDINDVKRTYDCDSLGLRDVYIYVWDEAGNFSVVKTFIVIQDNDNLCPGSLRTILVSGLISTKGGKTIEDVDVNFDLGNHIMESQSDQNGRFKINDVPMHASGALINNYHKNYLDGVTTADIVRIQQHILGVKEFENPEDYIAADVDQNARVTAKDITILRNLILGNSVSLPNEKSYCFIDKQYVFNDRKNPYKECSDQEVMKLNDMTQDREINILGIKLGDVNHSLNINNTMSRSVHYNSLKYEIVEDKILIFSSFDKDIIGMQLGLDLTELCMSGDNIQFISNAFAISNDLYAIRDNKLLLALDFNKRQHISNNQLLFTLKSNNIKKDCASLDLCKGIQQEIILSDNVVETLELISNQSSNNAQGFSIEDIKSNLFTGQLSIKINSYEEQTLNLQVLSLDAKVLYQKQISLQERVEELSLNKSELNLIPGTYIIHLEARHNNEVFKMIIH